MFIFSLALVVFWVINNFVIFHKIKVAKHSCDPCCHLAAETGFLFNLIESSFTNCHNTSSNYPRASHYIAQLSVQPAATTQKCKLQEIKFYKTHPHCPSCWRCQRRVAPDARTSAGTTVDNVTKLFSSSLTPEQNKLDRLSLAISVILARKAEA